MSLGTLALKHDGLIRTIGAGYVIDSHDQDDLLQEGRTIIHRRRVRIQELPETQHGAFISAIVNNHFKNLCRRYGAPCQSLDAMRDLRGFDVADLPPWLKGSA